MNFKLLTVKIIIPTLCAILLFFVGLPTQSFAQVLNYDRVVEISNSGVKHTTNTFLIQVNSPSEKHLGEITLFDNEKSKLDIIYARVLNKEGKVIRKLKKEDFERRNARFNSTFYDDNMATSFNLTSNDFPYQIEYKYKEKDEEYVNITSWFPSSYTNLATLNASLTFIAPKKYEYRINQTGDLKFEETVNKGKKVLTWKSNMIAPITPEQYMRPIGEILPKVEIQPIDFKYGVEGSYSTWDSFGKFIIDLNADSEKLTKKEEKTIDNLVAGMTDTVEIIRTLYHYLQDHTTYVNVSIKEGGLRTYPATYVCTNKYGDCKALTNYMKTVLKYVGIDSYYSIINAGSDADAVDPTIPSQQFNHVILSVPLKKDTIWLENTTSTLPFNYLGTFTQNRYSLAINKKDINLVKTPALEIDDVTVEYTYDYEVKNSGPSKSVITLKLRGRRFEAMRDYLATQSKEEQTEYLERIVNIKKLKIDDWEVIDYDRDKPYLDIKIQATQPNIIRKIASYQVITPLNISLPDLEKPADRKYELKLSYPVQYVETTNLTLNLEGNKNIELPKEFKLDYPFGQYKSSFKKVGDKITVIEQFTMQAGIYSLKEYAEIYTFIETIRKNKRKTSIIIQ